jgi:hypothetical protein
LLLPLDTCNWFYLPHCVVPCGLVEDAVLIPKWLCIRIVYLGSIVIPSFTRKKEIEKINAMNQRYNTVLNEENEVLDAYWFNPDVPVGGLTASKNTAYSMAQKTL